MKLSVGKDNLQNALHKVLSVVSTRTTIPVLSNALLAANGDGLTITTTDLEVSITTRIAATVEKEGEITLPAKKLGQIIDRLPSGDVLIDTDEQHSTRISCNEIRYHLMGMDAAEFPRENNFQEERRVRLPAVAFGKLLRKIGYSVSQDQGRLVLTGILLSIREGNFTAVATDGRRLALIEQVLESAEPQMDGDVVLPGKVASELQRLLVEDGDVEIRTADARISFQFGSTTLISKLVDGAYPNYRQVVPDNFSNAVVIPREQLALALSRVSLVVTESGSSVKFNLKPGHLLLSAKSAEYGEASEPLEVSYEGQPLVISFNPDYLADPLKFLECDELTLRFNDEYKPVVLLGDEGFLYVIMPMRN